MSDRTPCNHCTLERIEAKAKVDGKTVTTMPRDGGIAVYVHPEHRRADTTPDTGDQVAWFMALSESCCC